MSGDMHHFPESLRKRVLVSIRQEERRRAQAYLLVSAGVTVASSAGVFVSVTYLAQELSRSNFLSYMSLLVSDTDIVFANSASFLASLVETLPLLGVISLCAALLLFFSSMRICAVNVRGIIPSFNNA